MKPRHNELRVINGQIDLRTQVEVYGGEEKDQTRGRKQSSLEQRMRRIKRVQRSTGLRKSCIVSSHAIELLVALLL